MTVKHRPASILPFEVAEEHYAYIYGRFALDPTRRAGVPLRAICLKQRRTGAKRGESPRLLGFDKADLQDLLYLAHAANAYGKLVEYLQKESTQNPGYPGDAARALLREVGEAP